MDFFGWTRWSKNPNHFCSSTPPPRNESTRRNFQTCTKKNRTLSPYDSGIRTACFPFWREDCEHSASKVTVTTNAAEVWWGRRTVQHQRDQWVQIFIHQRGWRSRWPTSRSQTQNHKQNQTPWKIILPSDEGDWNPPQWGKKQAASAQSYMT